VDFDNDDILDFISGSYDPGNVYLFRGAGNGKYEAIEEILDKAGQPVVHHPVEFAKYEQLKNDANADQDALIELQVASFGSWVAPVDWEADGDLDLLIGSFAGELFRRINEGTRSNPVYGLESIPVEADGEPLKVHAHADPVVADWNSDGTWDLVVSSGDGSVGWYENVGSRTAPKFGPRQILVPPAADSKFFEQNLKPGEVPVPGVRAQICVTDYNSDGLLDLILGDYSNINITRELSPAEQNEYRQLADKQKELAAAIKKTRQEMFADGVDGLTREKLEKKYRSVADEYGRLEERRMRFFDGSGRASFIWLYLRTSADGRSDAEASAGHSRESVIVAGERQTTAIGASNQEDESPVSVRASITPISTGVAKRFKLSIEFAIADEWHLTKLTPETPRLTLKLPAGIRALGEWHQPSGTPSRADPTVQVYEGSVIFSHDLELTSTDASPVLEVEIGYQVCNQKFCLPPEKITKSLSLPRE